MLSDEMNHKGYWHKLWMSMCRTHPVINKMLNITFVHIDAGIHASTCSVSVQTLITKDGNEQVSIYCVPSVIL